MTVTEQVMAQGDFSVKLSPETPAELTMALAGLTSFAHAQIIVTESWMPPDQIHGLMEDQVYDYTAQPGTIQPSDPNPLPYGAGPRYTGILHRVNTELDGPVNLTGFGLQSLLGDARTGQFIYRRDALDESYSLGVEGAVLFDDVLDGVTYAGASPYSWPPSPLRRRYYFVPDDLPESILFGEDVAGYIPRISLLEMIAVRWNLEWVIRSHARVDMGRPEELYPGDTPIITRFGGDDRTDDGGRVEGLTAASLALDTDLAGWGSGVLLTSGEGPTMAGPSLLGRDPFGRHIEMTHLLDRSDVSGDAAYAYAAAELAKISNPHREISVSATTHDGLDNVVCGQRIDIYDPVQGLGGGPTARLHRGEWLQTIPTRVTGHTWPIRAGMGVYVRRALYDPVGLIPIPGPENYHVIDLTEYVEFEDGDASITVGDPPRPEFPAVSAPPLLDPSDPLASPEGQGHVATQRRLGQTEVTTAATEVAVAAAIAADPAGTSPTTLAQALVDLYAHRNDP